MRQALLDFDACMCDSLRQIIHNFHDEWEKSLLRQQIHSHSNKESSTSDIETSDVNEIVSLGFTKAQAREALSCLRVTSKKNRQKRCVPICADVLRTLDF